MSLLQSLVDRGIMSPTGSPAPVLALPQLQELKTLLELSPWTDEQWIALLRDGALVTSLVLAMGTRSDANFNDQTIMTAAYVLVHLGNIHPTMWSTFELHVGSTANCNSVPLPLWTMLTTINDHATAVLEKVDRKHENEERFMVWLALLHQMYVYRIPVLGGMLGSFHERSCDSEIQLGTTARALVAVLERADLSIFEYIIKVLAAVNCQFPPHSITISTPIALLMSESMHESTQLCEGVLYLFNESSFHVTPSPELHAILQLCIDLVNKSIPVCFFYENDIKVMVEVVARELKNLPADIDPNDGSVQSHVKDTRVMYLRLCCCLLGTDGYRHIAERSQELQDELKSTTNIEQVYHEDSQYWAKEALARLDDEL